MQKKFAKEIFIVDSFSTDETVEIATEMGVKVYQHPFKNHSAQFKWGLENLPIKQSGYGNRMLMST